MEPTPGTGEEEKDCVFQRRVFSSCKEKTFLGSPEHTRIPNAVLILLYCTLHI